MFADFISKEDALEMVLPHLLDLDRDARPGLGQIALVQTPQVFYNRNVLVRIYCVWMSQDAFQMDMNLQSTNCPIAPALQGPRYRLRPAVCKILCELYPITSKQCAQH